MTDIDGVITTDELLAELCARADTGDVVSEEAEWLIRRLRARLDGIYVTAGLHLDGKGGPYWNSEDAASKMADALRRIHKAAEPTEGPR